MKNQNKILKHVHQWIEHADEDLRLAEYAMTMKTGVPYRLVVYHSQQCAEKYLKAYLVNRNIDFPYTHNISLLLEKCSFPAEQVTKLQNIAVLTKYGTTARYPGEYQKLNKEDTLRAISLAKKARKFIRNIFTKEGLLNEL